MNCTNVDLGKNSTMDDNAGLFDGNDTESNSTSYIPVLYETSNLTAISPKKVRT